jgi:DNA repair exonuclease SbcCD ATPase subunit
MNTPFRGYILRLIICVVAFTVNDLRDLLRLLREQPDWLSEVRRVVLAEELLALPRELAEVQRHTDERFAELAEAIKQLTLRFEEAQRRNDERFAELAEAIKQLTLRFEEAQRRNDERFAELAEAIRQLTLRFEEAQRRNDERFEEAQRSNDERSAELAEFQRRADERFAELAEAIRQLTLRFEEAQRRNDERFAELAEFQRRTDERFAELAEAIRQLTLRFEEAQQRNDNQFADIRGKLLEIEYRNKIGAIFGGRLRKPRVVDAGDVWDMLRDQLGEAEIRRIVAADLIVRGGLLRAQGEGELWLVVEVSSVIDRNDVARAAERAALLRKADLMVVPVVAGQRLTQGAVTLAEEFGVAIARNGGLDGWDKALAEAGGPYPPRG